MDAVSNLARVARACLSPRLMHDLCDVLGVPLDRQKAVKLYGEFGALVGILPVQTQGTLFDVVEGERPAAILAAYRYLDAPPMDLVAVRPDEPGKAYTLLGIANALGQPAIDRARYESVPLLKSQPASLKVHATPLDWLRSGCEGACVLNRKRTPAILADIDECVTPAAFAPTLHKLLHQDPPHLPQVMVPESESIAT